MRYTESHEWIKVDGKVGTVGITSYAQKELGEIVSVELPKLGQIVKSKEEICVLESTKAAADVYSPVAGKIVAVNDAIKADSSLINKNAESLGWLFQIEINDISDLDHLMSEKEYNSLIH